MVTATHYPRAPITEAIIDLRIAPADGLVAAHLERIRDEDDSSYPKKERVVMALGHIEVGARSSASVQSETFGYKFTSADGKYIWQARTDGMTLSRLAPYESWEPFREEARRLWGRYREVTKPQKIERLAVRYINRVDIPADEKDFEVYFRTLPEISPDLRQPLTSFFLQLRQRHDDLQAESIINQTIVRPNRPEVISVVLDVDLFRDVEPPQVEEGVWEYFEQLHVRKNEIFEACITDPTRELIR